jgi:hypothetical protein
VIANTLILCRILRMMRLGRPWTILIQNLQGTPGVFVLVYQWMVSNLTALIVLHTLVGQFCDALQFASQQMSERRVYIPCSYDSKSLGTEEPNEYIFVSIDGRVERTMTII